LKVSEKQFYYFFLLDFLLVKWQNHLNETGLYP